MALLPAHPMIIQHFLVKIWGADENKIFPHKESSVYPESFRRFLKIWLSLKTVPDEI